PNQTSKKNFDAITFIYSILRLTEIFVMGWNRRVHISAFAVALMLLPAAARAQGSAELLREAKQLEAQKNYPAAEDVDRRIVAAEPGNLEALKQIGILEQTNLQFDASIGQFQQVLAHTPDYPQVNFFLGLSYYGKRDYENAITSFQNELKTPSPHP